MAEGGDGPVAGPRLLADLNAIAVSLLADHPGHEYVFPYVREGFSGDATLLVFDYVPLRAEYVLTRRYGVDEHQARNVVQQFLRQPIDVVGADADAILEAYEVSARMDHGVYDCFLVSLARRHDADAILTTDSDFEFLCAEEAFDYLNPIPDNVLARFHERRDD